MAIVGFILCFLILLYLTFALVLSLVGILALNGTINTEQKMFTSLGSIGLLVCWYWLLHDIIISIGGI